MKKIDWEILVNHLTGVSSEIEEEELAEWLSETEENRTLYERVKITWSAERKALTKPDTEKALNLVLSRIRQSDAATETKVIRFAQSPGRKQALSLTARSYIVRVAAAIVVAVGAIYLLTTLTSRRETGEISLTFNSMQTIELSDGTRVTADIGSSFAYPESFADGHAREVSLEGEAYFDVAKNDRVPFIVRAGAGRIEVLGTKFNVRAWKGDRQIVLAVQEGTVSFQTEGNNDTSKVVYVRDNEASRLIEGQSPTTPEEVDVSRYLSWMKREIYFQNTPVPEVLNQLERWYNVTIETADSSMLRNNITVFIENKRLVENLNLISVVMNAPYVQQGDTIRFLPH
jgi:transmembrane sensor